MAWNRYDNWSAVLSAARKHDHLYYQAPLDHRVYKKGKIRLDPETAGTDPFTADRGHLDRFRWLD